MKLLAPAVISAFVAPLLVSAAPAEAAVKEPIPSGEIVFHAADGEGCAFDVKSVYVSKETLTVRRDGTQVITGMFKATLTNLSTGTSITVNASGPGSFAEISVARGGQLFVVKPGEFGGPGIVLRHGRIVFGRTDVGFIDPITVTGNVRNLCNDLA